MEYNNILKDFFNSLNMQEELFSQLLKDDRLGIILRSAVNELNLMAYKNHSEYNAKFSQEGYYYIFKLGVSRLVKLSLEARFSYEVPSIMFLHSVEISTETHNIVSGLGMIEHGRRIAQSVYAGHTKIGKAGENAFKITIPSTLIDEESHERYVSNYYKEQLREKLVGLVKSSYMEKFNIDVDNQLFDLVYPYKKFFIGYQSAPILDEFFFGLTYAELFNHDGFDTFHYSIKFGGIEYQKYKLAISFIMSVIEKHVRFSEKLIMKDMSIKVENILTISLNTDEFIGSMCDAINYFGAALQGYTHLKLNDARKIFEVLSYSRRNIKLLDNPGAELPMLIQSSDESFFFCIAARYSSPLQYLHDSLRFHFSKDYDKQQQSQEQVLQRAIKNVLNNSFDYLEYQENIKIKENGKTLTDIDMVVIEKNTGIVFLCQLKHQELYGADLHAKHIRTTRLKKQASSWLASVNSWLNNTTEKELRKSLQITKHVQKLTIYKLFITKHYAFPLKGLSDEYTAYCNWPQLIYAMQLIENDVDNRNNSIWSLMHKLKGLKQREENSYIHEPTSKWTIKDLSFIVEQEK
ncbi:hypothetical protein [Leclercia adecarboxylata]|uniref:hypothetical protein n=1 Tax=Leclercia adecarboxylata TaxID=83655 RepID=UPI0013C96276|nr:hypothetical protein [Leclercia adecarboxylata]NEG94507.1 hypothetical protein [Leclercia adecarboxylata]